MADRAPEVPEALAGPSQQEPAGDGATHSEYHASEAENSHTRQPCVDTQRSAESDLADNGQERTFPSQAPDERHTLRSPGVSEPRGCLNEDDALEFAQGLLSASEIERAEAHVDSCASCRRLLGEAMLAVDPLAATEDGSTPEFALLRPGNVLGARYRILRFHASGGMGEVYEAYDVELGERVALKTISPAAGDRERAVRYLKAEVQLARRVSHPNVCRTFEFGTDDNPMTGAKLHYLTMEFVEGESLCKYLRKHGPLPLAQARQIAEQILRGLGAAHQAGVLHRDLKTDNVLLRSGPKGSHALLSDFGLARALDFEGYGARQSAQGWVGTPDYMAPEQLEGRPLTAASDLYAFGLVFYEMLTGKLPFPRCRHTVALSARLKVTPSAPSRENPEIPP
ncbi:MAG TPA: serine/threonine-protein kinase, partial [Polyangiaceae bacterium]|nr:serine/threonine-protein kinase [Polyangiaceae bacterium]